VRPAGFEPARKALSSFPRIGKPLS